MHVKSRKWKKPVLGAAALTLAGSLVFMPDTGEAKSLKHSIEELNEKEKIYSADVTETVLKALKKETKGKFSVPEALILLQTLSKTEVMDIYFDQSGKKLKPNESRKIILDIFKIDLDAVSALGEGRQADSYPDETMKGIRKELGIDPESTSKDSYIMSLSKVQAMDLYIAAFGKKISGEELRLIINQVFGINLDGISGLEKARVSLYSKNQWITQTDRDLVVVHTGRGDVDVWIYPTAYFKEKTGLQELPPVLQEKLKALGFTYNEQLDAFYYANDKGVSVSDAFKGQTMGAVISTIAEGYSDL
ncbi:hypothetical protein [Jeotgalibacillus campisalis]|uniref:Uncharacterized protein n=1 Tax=Jeotgalibacillus campisalis TaxID=220754 RepID=A0A0C2R9Y4_9BACL|nr:hypothetical protein [Jeotgalibacillus campisalis]KIL47115.1 hypothetical protein KR50_24370 [Jeotgalibacillus campisalis]